MPPPHSAIVKLANGVGGILAISIATGEAGGAQRTTRYADSVDSRMYVAMEVLTCPLKGPSYEGQLNKARLPS